MPWQTLTQKVPKGAVRLSVIRRIQRNPSRMTPRVILDQRPERTRCEGIDLLQTLRDHQHLGRIRPRKQGQESGFTAEITKHRIKSRVGHRRHGTAAARRRNSRPQRTEPSDSLPNTCSPSGRHIGSLGQSPTACPKGKIRQSPRNPCIHSQPDRVNSNSTRASDHHNTTIVRPLPRDGLRPCSHTIVHGTRPPAAPTGSAHRLRGHTCCYRVHRDLRLIRIRQLRRWCQAVRGQQQPSHHCRALVTLEEYSETGFGPTAAACA